jgi:DNA repair exonuclease SbcCD nuclease subunit
MAENDAKENLEQRPVSEPSEPQQMEGVVTVVLTADNHLGYAGLSQQPRKREECRRRLRHAFQMATDFAVNQGVDLFIQAGDLFDTPNPDERDRSFVAERLAQLRKKGIRAFALGGVHDTPVNSHSVPDKVPPAPQISFERLGALHYFAPQNNKGTAKSTTLMEPVIIDVHGVRIGICGLSVVGDQEGDPLAHLRVQDDIEGAAISLLVLHAPIEDLVTGSSSLEIRAQVGRASIANQTKFQHILAGYHHAYRQLRIGHCNVVVAGATQHFDFSDLDDNPGFVFLGLAADGIRWCNHIPVDSMPLRRLVVNTSELWPDGTERVIEQLRPLCDPQALVQVRLEGALTRGQYHQLDFNQVRRYGEEHCFALIIDDSALSLLPEQEGSPTEIGERLSLREELEALAKEWIDDAQDEQEKKALQATREELLAALDDEKGRR